MSSKFAAVFSKKNTSLSTLSNDSSKYRISRAPSHTSSSYRSSSVLTLVNEKPAHRRTQPQDAFGALTGTYGFAGSLAGPPPVNPSGSKKADKARKVAEKAASKPASTPNAALVNTYGYAGTLAGPPPVNPSGSKKADRARKAAAAAAAAVAPDAFGTFVATYGFSGSLMGPPPVNPSGSSSKKALRR